MSPRTSKTQEPGFEQSMGRLKEISDRLDNPETGLEETIALVEEGLKLIARSKELLQEAELRIKTLENPAAAQTPAQPADSRTDDGFTLL